MAQPYSSLALTPYGRSRTRIAVFTRSIDYALSDSTGKTGFGDVVYKLGIMRAPSLYWNHSMALRHVSTETSKKLLSFVAAQWNGNLWDLDMLGLTTTVGYLPTHEEQLRVAELLPFCRTVRAAMLSRNSQLALLNGVIMKPSDRIPAEVMEQLTMELASLEKALLEKDPMMRVHLQKSHRMIQDYPETTNLLEDKEIALIIDGLELHTKTEIVKISSKPAAAGRRAAKITADDL